MESILQKEFIRIIFFLISPALISYFLIPFIKKLAYKFIILDKPNYRKLHSKPIPNVGGISIFIAYFINILFIKYFTNLNIKNLNTILSCSFLIMLIGLLDDIYSLSPRIRLSIQFLVTSFIWSKGINISNINFDYLNLGIGAIEIPTFLSLCITCLWIVGVINAINWIDGINGLASGVIILILLGTSTIAFSKSFLGLFFISIIIMSSCLGFLIQNLKPNNIIMGDNGSNFLGFNLSILCLYAAGNESNSLYSSDLSIFPLIPFLLLGFPIFDMVRVICSRIAKKKSPFLPDRSHFHHLLLHRGFTNNGALLIIYNCSLYLISSSLLFTDINKNYLFWISNFLLLISIFMIQKKYLKR